MNNFEGLPTPAEHEYEDYLLLCEDAEHYEPTDEELREIETTFKFLTKLRRPCWAREVICKNALRKAENDAQDVRLAEDSAACTRAYAAAREADENEARKNEQRAREAAEDKARENELLRARAASLFELKELLRVQLKA